MDLRNPYTNRTTILNEIDFFGRERELRSIYTRLLGGASVMLIGERRTGKSSILSALNFQSERESMGIPPNLCVAYTDCQEVAGCGERQFLEYIGESFAHAMKLPLPKLIDRAAFKKIGLDSHLKSGLQPVLAIDEFDVLLENDLLDASFLAFLRSWSSGAQVPIVLASWEGSVEDLAQSRGAGSAFLNIFAPVYVGPLDSEDAEALITFPAESIGEPFSPDDLEWIRAFGGLHPFFLQIACYHMLEARRTVGAGGTARLLAEKNFMYDTAPHLRFLVGRLTHGERAVLEDWHGELSAAKSDVGYEGLFRKGILIRDPEPRIFSAAFAKVFAQSHGGL